MDATSSSLREQWSRLATEAAQIELGGGPAAVERQHRKGRLTARERIARLVDPGTSFHEFGLWAAWEMYAEYGGAPAAGVVCGVGSVAGRRHVVIANDATVKAGAFFPATAKKVLRSQRIAFQNRLPLIYLVDSAGVFLPLQDDVFPDEDDFGRIFRNNAVFSAAGLGQTAAIMGNCVAGGGYLPVLCDKLLMTDGSGLYLAGPALVKSAIGQVVSSDDLGGAAMHAQVSGTIDYREPNDEACLARLRSLAALVAADSPTPPAPFSRRAAAPPRRDPREVYDVVSGSPRRDYEAQPHHEGVGEGDACGGYEPEFGKALVCGSARIGGFPVGIVANQHHAERPTDGPLQFGGVLYVDGAEKAARFVMNCNQDWLPLVFFQDVNGFMVGRDSERAGIIKAGAKLVSAVSNSRVPKITVIVGGSYGAGNYALCGKAFDPRLILAWPSARCAVMGADQAVNTLVEITVGALERKGETVDDAHLANLRERVRADYERATDPRYAAARGWIDRIIDPATTRDELTAALEIVTRSADDAPYKLGVFQV